MVDHIYVFPASLLLTHSCSYQLTPAEQDRPRPKRHWVDFDKLYLVRAGSDTLMSIGDRCVFRDDPMSHDFFGMIKILWLFRSFSRC
jgi:hypothetical protein